MGIIAGFLARHNPLTRRQRTGQALVCWGLTDIDERKGIEEKLATRKNVALREEIGKASMFEEIVGISPALQAVLSRISKVATQVTPRFSITGETGTGKELCCPRHPTDDHIVPHAPSSSVKHAPRSPRDLIASELFGHERGGLQRARLSSAWAGLN